MFEGLTVQLQELLREGLLWIVCGSNEELLREVLLWIVCGSNLMLKRSEMI
jgi:hypothetical protein